MVCPMEGLTCFHLQEPMPSNPCLAHPPGAMADQQAPGRGRLRSAGGPSGSSVREAATGHRGGPSGEPRRPDHQDPGSFHVILTTVRS